MAALIVLVNADPTVLRRAEQLLSDAGYVIAPASSFAGGRELLRSVRPDLLVADVRLEAYNGLQLAAYCNAHYPGMPIVITHSRPDSVLERDAGRLGAVFIVDPLSSPEFLTAVQSAIATQTAVTPTRRWPRKSTSATMTAQLEALDASICDVSYGGMRLAFSGECDVPTEFDVTVPEAGVTLHAQRVWMRQSPVTSEFWCGAEIRPTDDSGLSEWREFVDSIN
jgi:DNA-binding NtrC family response regulator